MTHTKTKHTYLCEDVVAGEADVLATIPLSEYRGNRSEDHGGDAKDSSGRLRADVGPWNDAGALEALDVCTAVVVAVQKVSLQVLLALGGGRVQVGANLGDRVGILLIPVVLVFNITWLLARDATGVDDGLLRVGNGVSIVDSLVEAVGGGIAAGLVGERSEEDAPSIGRAIYSMSSLLWE